MQTRRADGSDFNSEVMTLYEVADYLHCSYYTVQKLARRGKIPGFRLLGDNGTWRVLKSELERWIAKGGGLR